MRDEINALNSMVTPVDTTSPVITLTGSSAVTLSVGATYAEEGATATDNHDASVTVTIGGDVVNTAVAGTYTVTYNAVDLAGNHALAVTRTITISNGSTTTTPPSGGGGGGSSPAPKAVTVVATTTASTTPKTTTPGEVLGASTYNFTRDLAQGMSGQDVTELQKVLIKEGYLTSSSPLGYFGPLTRAAVVKYQVAHGITPAAGYVGPKTRAVLNAGQGTAVSGIQQKIAELLAKVAALQALLSAVRALLISINLNAYEKNTYFIRFDTCRFGHFACASRSERRR
jgi:hypothetical protein